jgi:REP element-mobilizing transposase RayT
MSRPLAYLITWTTYGTWLPGDERGWVKSGDYGIKPPDAARHGAAAISMATAEVRLTPSQRSLVEETVRADCLIRRWTLHAANARSNHVHVVVRADVTPETVLSQLKAWCARRLSEQAGLTGRSKNGLKRWWTEHGSTKWINNEEYFRNAVRYVSEGQ